MDINLFKTLSEKQRKLFLGQEAINLGWGGISSVSRQYQVSRATVSSAVALVKAGVTYDPREGERKKGGGRKPIEETYPEIETIVISLVKESSYGSPSEEKAWTTLSAEKIKEILESEHKIVVCPNTVRKILRNNHYSRQQNKKMLQVGEPDPNRDKQFENIKRECEKFKKTGDPILSGDTKKKEIIGNNKNNGTEWRKEKDPRPVDDHDFSNAPKLIPYGLFDTQRQRGFVNCTTSHDTPEFVYNTIKAWWAQEGEEAYPNAKRLLFLTDSGGSDSYRSRMFKKYMQDLADETGLEIHICHYPRGTSKWNPIEHRLFGVISKNIQAKPLVSVEYATKLIGSTTTKTGLTVHCQYDEKIYEVGQKISDKDFSAIPIKRKRSVRKLNYWFAPKMPRKVKRVG